MNLGPSPVHARNVNLVLNLETGLTSPQFHVQYDNFFKSVRPGMNNPPTTSLWQIKSGLRAAQVSKADPFKGAGQSRSSRAAIFKRRDEESPKPVEQQQESPPALSRPHFQAPPSRPHLLTYT
eukprot:3692908-Ditylum_brightwellii.AAC.1